MSTFSVFKMFTLRIKVLESGFHKNTKKNFFFGSSKYLLYSGFLKKIINVDKFILTTKSFKLSYPHIFPIRCQKVFV